MLRDWQASGSVLAYSGQPFTPGVRDSGSRTGHPPDRLCNGTLSNRTLAEWFDPVVSLFLRPVLAIQGVTFSAGQTA